MRRLLLPAAIAAIAGLVLAAGVTASPDTSATVRFGNPDAGSGFPPPDGHDASSNAKDNMIPRTAVIAAGGTVTFEFAGDHQAVVYDAGTAPEDITVPAFPPNFFVTPPFGLTPGQLAKGPLPGDGPVVDRRRLRRARPLPRDLQHHAAFRLLQHVRLGDRHVGPQVPRAAGDARRTLLHSAAGGRPTAAFPSDDHLHRKAGRDQARLVRRGCRGEDPGRLATQIADTLRGKGKPQYTAHVDTGDFVIVVNAEKIHVTGKKLDEKMVRWHSGYPGGLKERTLREQLQRRPTEVIRKAVKGMLPKNKLASAQIRKLKVYAGPEHPHAAQSPKTLEL